MRIVGETETSLKSVTTAYGLRIQVGNWIADKQTDSDGRVVRINDRFHGLVMWEGDNVPSPTQWIDIYDPD